MLKIIAGLVISMALAMALILNGFNAVMMLVALVGILSISCMLIYLAMKSLNDDLQEKIELYELENGCAGGIIETPQPRSSKYASRKSGRGY